MLRKWYFLSVTIEKASDRHPKQFDADTSIHDYPDRQAGITWPTPVDAKLMNFVGVVITEGGRTTRREMAAALIVAANYQPEELLEILRNYRLANVSDVIPSPAEPPPES